MKTKTYIPPLKTRRVITAAILFAVVIVGCKRNGPGPDKGPGFTDPTMLLL